MPVDTTDYAISGFSLDEFELSAHRLLAPNAPGPRSDVITDFRRSKSPGKCSGRKRDLRRKLSREHLVLGASPGSQCLRI